MSGWRAAVVGARRVRQGTGEYVARELQRAGVEVCAIVGTRPESLREAQEGLEARHGIRARGYLSLRELLEREEQIDVVAVCSPMEAHAEQVALALEAGCHVFCEKPLLWEAGAERDPSARARLEAAAQRLAALSAETGRLLALNTQWPFTLGAFAELHPGVLEAGTCERPTLSRFAMHLGPTRTGAAAMIDSGSHPLSMLQALAGPGSLADVRVVYSDPEPASAEPTDDSTRDLMTTTFCYEHRQGRAEVCVRLRRHPNPPRPAGFGIEGALVERVIDLPEYRISLEHRGQRAAVGDPLAGAVDDFVRRARAGEHCNAQALRAGVTQLWELARAAHVAAEREAGVNALAGEESP